MIQFATLVNKWLVRHWPRRTATLYWWIKWISYSFHYHQLSFIQNVVVESEYYLQNEIKANEIRVPIHIRDNSQNYELNSEFYELLIKDVVCNVLQTWFMCITNSSLLPHSYWKIKENWLQSNVFSKVGERCYVPKGTFASPKVKDSFHLQLQNSLYILKWNLLHPL